MGRLAVENLLLIVACTCIFFLRLCPAPHSKAVGLSDSIATEWHSACLLIVGFLLTLVFFDDTPIILTHEGHTVKLLGLRRWYTLATQGYTALLLYLAISVAIDCGLDSTRMQRTAAQFLAVSHTTSIFSAVSTKFVLMPAYHHVGRWAKLGFGGRPRPLYLYNSGLLITTGELTLTGRNLALRHLPAVLLFAAWFCACHLKLLKEQKVCIYTPLDYNKPFGWLVHLCAFAMLSFFFSLGPLTSFFSAAAPLGRPWTHLVILGATLLLIPLREPKRLEVARKAEKMDKAD